MIAYLIVMGVIAVGFLGGFAIVDCAPMQIKTLWSIILAMLVMTCVVAYISVAVLGSLSLLGVYFIGLAAGLLLGIFSQDLGGEK